MRVVLLLFFLGILSPGLCKEAEISVYEQPEIFIRLGEVFVEKGKVRVKAQKQTLLLKISKGGNDNDDRSTWRNVVVGKVGDTFRDAGGQHNLYWEIKEIREDRVKFRRYGFVFRVGSLDEVFWLKLNQSE